MDGWIAEGSQRQRYIPAKSHGPVRKAGRRRRGQRRGRGKSRRPTRWRWWSACQGHIPDSGRPFWAMNEECHNLHRTKHETTDVDPRTHCPYREVRAAVTLDLMAHHSRFGKHQRHGAPELGPRPRPPCSPPPSASSRPSVCRSSVLSLVCSRARQSSTETTYRSPRRKHVGHGSLTCTTNASSPTPYNGIFSSRSPRGHCEQ